MVGEEEPVVEVSQAADRRDLPPVCSGRGGSEPAEPEHLSRPSQLNATDRAQRAALNLANLATCAMVSRSPER